MSASHLLKLLEPLAEMEHERWAHWQRYLHSKCSRNDDGSLTIPNELVMRWERQIKTPYHNLTEAEKESDREQVMGYLKFIINNIGLD